MTLNLMLTSKDAVYLSGDFRITSLKDQAALPDSYDTQKLIPVIRRGWAALITYMGVASAPPLISDMGQWIVEQMDSIPIDGSFSELSRRLLRFNLWLGRICGDRRIAFSVVGFWNQRPFMMLSSNFLDSAGHIVDAGPQLRAYLEKTGNADLHMVSSLISSSCMAPSMKRSASSCPAAKKFGASLLRNSRNLKNSRRWSLKESSRGSRG
jgi:hypothetical protein